MNIYSLMVETASKLGLPRRYTDDLHVYDRNWLDGDDVPPVFGWVLYESGTHVVDPTYTDGVDANMVDVFRSTLVRQGLFATDQHCYVWTGTELREMCDAAAMLDYLEDYRA